MLQVAALGLVSPLLVRGMQRAVENREMGTDYIIHPIAQAGQRSKVYANLLEDNQRAMLRVALTACS